MNTYCKLFSKKSNSKINREVMKENESFGTLSRGLFYANMLVDVIIEENLPKVEELVKIHGVRGDLVVPERGVAALHILAGMENEEFSQVATLTVMENVFDIDVLSEEGLAPIHVAAMWGRSKVIQVLLTSGADPYLEDSTNKWTPSNHAMMASQWRTYDVLLTYIVILEDPDRYAKYMDVEEDTVLKKSKNTARETHEVSEESELRNFDQGGILELNDKAINMIMSQRRKTKVYESTAEDEIDADDSVTSIESKKTIRSKFSKDRFRNINKKLNKINTTKISDYRRKYLSEEHFEISNSPKLSDKTNSSSSFQMEIPTWIMQEKKYKYETDAGRDRRRRGNPRDENDVYFCGIAESTFQSKSKCKAARSSHSSETVVSGFEHLKAVNSRVLCKMSRIFLFMLKKNHVYEKVK